MLTLPIECHVNRSVYKKKFYNEISMTSSLKSQFEDKITSIKWLYKISEDIVGIPKTDEVEEIEVFEIRLKQNYIPINALKAISKSIPYKILFILKYKRKFCYAIMADKIYYSQWNEEITIDFNYNNLELLYESLVKKIIKEEENNNALNKILDKKNKMDNLNKEIEILSNKVKLEKQFDRKVELNNKLNKLKKEMEELKNE